MAFLWSKHVHSSAHPRQSLPRLITSQHSPMSVSRWPSTAFWLPSSQRLGGLSLRGLSRKKENETNLCKCMQHKSDCVSQVAQIAGVIYYSPTLHRESPRRQLFSSLAVYLGHQPGFTQSFIPLPLKINRHNSI